MGPRSLKPVLPLAVLAGALLAAPSARAADTSSWLSAGGGAGFVHNVTLDQDDVRPALSFALGVGTTPVKRWVVGGVFRSTTYVKQGTDLGVGLRFAQGSFARGDWGVAAELGPGARFYRGAGQVGRYPVQAKLLGGAPWGVELGVGADLLDLSGETQGIGFVAFVGVDLLRFTLNRQGPTEKFWPNPAPSGGHLPREE